eukprot:6185554-Pleurochrysis_carterae.AAC.2
MQCAPQPQGAWTHAARDERGQVRLTKDQQVKSGYCETRSTTVLKVHACMRSCVRACVHACVRAYERTSVRACGAHASHAVFAPE